MQSRLRPIIENERLDVQAGNPRRMRIIRRVQGNEITEIVKRITDEFAAGTDHPMDIAHRKFTDYARRIAEEPVEKAQMDKRDRPPRNNISIIILNIISLTISFAGIPWGLYLWQKNAGESNSEYGKLMILISSFALVLCGFFRFQSSKTKAISETVTTLLSRPFVKSVLMPLTASQVHEDDLRVYSHNLFRYANVCSNREEGMLKRIFNISEEFARLQDERIRENNWRNAGWILVCLALHEYIRKNGRESFDLHLLDELYDYIAFDRDHGIEAVMAEITSGKISDHEQIMKRVGEIVTSFEENA